MSVNSAITADQCRAARALLNISRSELAAKSNVGERTLADFESEARHPIRSTLAAIQSALEAGGIEFLAEDAAGAGVRFRSPRPKRERDPHEELLAQRRHVIAAYITSEVEDINLANALRFADLMLHKIIRQAKNESPNDPWPAVDRMVHAREWLKEVPG